MTNCKGLAAHNATTPLEPYSFERRRPGPEEVFLDITYCGLCHSDIHMTRNEWGNALYPMVPGHEIVGIVKEVGNNVDKFQIGDRVGVGCLVNSCGDCQSCADNLEQYCENGFTMTYGSYEEDGKTLTYGGYSQSIVAHQDFVLKITHDGELAPIAPLLCAGITTYSPLKHWNIGKGSKVGILGLGGLGHMGIKIALSMGAEVTVFTHSESKIADAKELGASQVVYSQDQQQMENSAESLDLILNTVSANIDLHPYLNCLHRDGKLILLGVPEHPTQLAAGALIFKRRTLAGSLIGGLKETQEMLDHCAKHNIVSDIELITADQINEAFERMIKGDVKYRFVLDNKSLG